MTPMRTVCKTIYLLSSFLIVTLLFPSPVPLFALRELNTVEGPQRAGLEQALKRSLTGLEEKGIPHP